MWDYFEISIKATWAGAVIGAVLVFISRLTNKSIENYTPPRVAGQLAAYKATQTEGLNFQNEMLKTCFNDLNDRLDKTNVELKKTTQAIEFNSKMGIEAQARNLRDIDDSLKAQQDHIDKHLRSVPV